MDQLHSEIILPIFRELNSVEMVRSRQICRRWLEIVDGNRSLFRKLDLPGKYWGLETLQLFDRRSLSTLQEVSMRIGLAYNQMDAFVEVLKRSKKTLRKVSISKINEHDYPRPSPNIGMGSGPSCKGFSMLQGLPPIESTTREDFSDLSWKLKNLVECEAFSPRSQVHLIQQPFMFTDGEQFENLPSLKVLSIDYSARLFQSHLHLLSNLSSLSVGLSMKSERWRDILVIPAPKLKHLNIKINEPSEISPPLEFPQLKVVEITCEDRVFPSWMRVPTSSAIILTKGHVLSSLPSVSECWLLYLKNSEPKSLLDFLERRDFFTTSHFFELGEAFPTLQKLVLNHEFHPDYFDEESMSLWSSLQSMLRRRKENVAAELRVDGVRMVKLRTLVFPCSNLDPEYLLELKELVEEVVDLDIVGRVMKVEY